MIAGMGLSREQVFIANIVKCRPPGNRVPALDEVETCTPYLVRQLEIVRPKVIVTLGRPSAMYMLNTKLAMGKLRGEWQKLAGHQAHADVSSVLCAAKLYGRSAQSGVGVI